MSQQTIERPAYTQEPVQSPVNNQPTVSHQSTVNIGRAITSCVLLSIRFNHIPGQKKISTDSLVTEDVDASRVKAVKMLYDSQQLKDIASADNRLRDKIDAISLPALDKPGFYLLPTGNCGQADEIILQYEIERRALVDAFIAVYAQEISRARERLGSYFRSDDYPPEEEARNSFKMRWAYVAEITPTSLQAVRGGIFEREKQKSREQWERMAANAEQFLALELLKLTEALEEVLKPTPLGRPPRFHESKIENLREFIQNFSSRNITGNQQLEAVCRQAERALLIQGTGKVTATALRQVPAARKAVHDGMAKVTEALSGMVIDGPRRKVKFDED